MGVCTRRGVIGRGIAGAWLALTLVFVPVAVSADVPPEAMAALAWLRTQQNADGGFPGFSGPESDPGDSADAAFAFLSAGIPLDEVKMGGLSLLDYLRATAADAKPGVAAKYLLIATAPSVSAGTFQANLSARTIAEKSDAGVYGGSYFVHALVLLAMSATASPEMARTLDNGVLLAAQHPDGGWSFDGKPMSDTNTTALAVQALIASGQGGDATTRALAYLEGTRTADGLYPYNTEAGDGDANSTAYVIQAKIAANADPAEIARATVALRTLQGPSGAFAFQTAAPGDNLLATLQAVPALAGRAFPRIAG